MKESRRFLQTVLVQEAEEETVTLLRKTAFSTGEIKEIHLQFINAQKLSS